MPMGIVSDSEFQRQIENTVSSPILIPSTENTDTIPTPTNNESNVVDTPPVTLEGEIVDDTVKQGRKLGDNNVPSGLRSLIAATHHIEGRPAALELAKEFGISSSSVSAYAKGVNSTKNYNDPKNPSIIDFVKTRKARVTKKALRVMTRALDNINDDKLELADAKDLSSIAKDMSAIVGNMSESNNTNGIGNQVNFVLMVPPIKSEESYESFQSVE